MDELVASVRQYLADPSLDRAKRSALVDLVCGPRDGQAGSRVARALVEVATQHG
jgi:hypothetical protein